VSAFYIFATKSNMTELVYREISCQKAVNGTNFSQGNQDYNFSIGNPTAWLPSKSYFRVTMSLRALGRSAIGAQQAPAQPTYQDQMAFADGAVSCLYTNVYFRAGGQDVSSIVNYVPQAHALKTRVMRSGAWMNSVGKSAYLVEADFQKRVAQIASDDPLFADAQEGSYINLTTAPAIPNNVDITAAGLVNTAAAGSVVPIYANLAVGDYVTVNNGSAYRVEVAGAAGVLTLSYRGAALTNANLSYGIRSVRRDGGQRNVVYALWQPPIGIFQHDKPMGPGDYRFALNPNSNYQRAAVQSTRLNGLNNASPPVLLTDNAGLVPASDPGSDVASAGDFALNIIDVKLYVATVKVSIPQEISMLELIEMEVLTKPIVSANASYEFTVPSSTIALAFFSQSGAAGSNTILPPTLFRQAAVASPLQNQNLLRSLQITYANSTKPSTRWASDYDNTVGGGLMVGGSINELQQRYNDDLQETGLISNHGGAESFGEWLQRGPYFYTRSTAIARIAALRSKSPPSSRASRPAPTSCWSHSTLE